MIRLTNSIKEYISPVISHPQQTGANSVLYVINHDMGVIPDYTRVYWHTTSPYDHSQLVDHYVASSTHYGYEVEGETSITSVSVRIFRLGGATYDVYIKTFSLGGTHVTS
jgi:hypothetical protein